MHPGSKAFFYALSRSDTLKKLASRYGMANDSSFARRFIAGETIEEAIGCARRLQARGMLLTLDYLGESVATLEEATAATREYLRLLDVIVASGIERNISLKVTQLGIDVDRATAVDNLRRILDPAQKHGFFVRIDMEESSYTDVTIEVFETLWQQGYRNIGVALQAYLYRSEQDVRRMNELGARVRLVKGAYKEPPSVAYQRKARCRRVVPPPRAAAARRRRLPGHRDARSGDARCNQGIRERARRRERSLRVPDAVRHPARPAERRWSGKATACGSTSPSASSGSLTSCAASANGRRMLASC